MITRYIEADRLVVDVTGDPVALLVALHTLVFFNPRVRASVMFRINALEKLMQGLDRGHRGQVCLCRPLCRL